MSSDAAPPGPGPGPAWVGPRVTALGLLALAVVALLATAAIPAGRDGWSMTGARFFPLLVSLGLLILGVVQLVRTTIVPDSELGRHAGREAAETDWRAPAGVAAALVAYVLMLEPLGYIVATALLFPAGARLLGSRSPVRDVIAGVGFAVAVYALFTKLLAVPLPGGLVGF